MNDLAINVSTVKDLKSNFDNELNHFKNTSFDTFNNSYFKMCTDPYVLRMNIRLSLMYDKLKSGYRNIDKWWTDYISNVEELEKTLSNDERAGLLETADIKNYINNNLQKLDDFKMSIAGIIATQIEQNKDSVKFANNEVVNNEDQFSDLYKDYNVNVVDIMKENIKKMFGKTNSKTTNEPKNVLNEEQQEKYDKVMDIVKTGAKMAIIASIFGSPSEKKTNEPEDIFTSFNNTVNNVKENVSDTINDIGEGVTDSFNNAKENINEFFDEASIVFDDLSKKTAAVTKEGAKIAIEKVSTISTNVSNWARDVVNDFQEDPVGFALDKIENTAATLALVVSSLSEGVGQFGEAIFDLGVILSSIQSTSAFVTSDIISYGISAITGSEFKSKTLQMWNGTQSFVAKEHITTWVDEWYENNFIGSWINENAYGFEPVRQVGSGVGYTAGVVLLTVLTAGVGGAAVGGGAAAASGGAAAAGSAATSATVTSAQLAMTATAAGIGKGTESAWADGAGIVEGLAAGTASGVWEGIQWYLGGKINSFNPVKGTGVDVKVVNSLARVVLDSIDGAAEGIAQPLIQTIYKDGYYDENGNYIKFESKDGILKRFNETFDDNGGVSSIATNAVIGGIGSAIGEIFDLGRFLKDNNSKINSDIKILTKEEFEKLPVAEKFNYAYDYDKKGYVFKNNEPEVNVSKIKEKVSLENEYKFPIDSIDEARRPYVEDWFEDVAIDKEIGQKLEEMFFDDNYIYGVHRTNNMVAANDISKDGLWLTGDTASGVAAKNSNLVFDDLENNISFQKGNSTYDYARFLRDITTASYYKNYMGNDVGYAMIIKIPKEKLGNLDDLIDYSGIQPVLKPEYIAGKIEVNDGNILSSNNINLKNNNMEINSNISSVDINGNPINKFDVPNTEGKQIAKNYIDNIDNYLKQGITFEDYLKNQGIDIKRVNNKIELAETLGDGKLYLFDKLKQLSASTNISNEQKIQVNQLLDTYSKLSVGDIDSNRMFDNIKVFLNEDEVNTYLNLSKNGVSDKMASNLSYEQKASVFNYTSAGGLEINAWLNDTVLPNSKGQKVRNQFNSIDKIQNLSSGIEAGGRKNWDFRADKGSIIDGLDSVISSAEYDDAIVTYRGVRNNIWDGNQKLDISLLKPGDSFSSAGYQSSSILFEDNYSAKRADYNVILEIIVPPKSGTAAYIENMTGVTKWAQSEVLIKRNATMTVIGDVYQKKINGILKTVVPVVVH